MAEAPAAPVESYSRWIRRVISAGRAGGRTILPLFESTVPEPRAMLTELVREAFADPVTDRYTSAFAAGNPFVVAALSRTYAVQPAQILCTTGATGAMALLYRALLEPGDHVLVETPGFDLLGILAREQGALVSTFQRPGRDFAIDVDRIAAALTPRTRLVVLTNLHNPSGLAADPAALRDLAVLAQARGFRVIVDEVYGDFATAEERPLAACHISPDFISVSSLTKAFGLSTLRCGWIVADPAIIATVRDLADRTEFGISNLAHGLAALVLERRDQFTAYSAAVLAAARPTVDDYFARWREAGWIDGPLPQSGCIAFPRLTGIADTLAFADDLFARSGSALVPGEFFGAAGHVRIGFALPLAQIEPAFAALDSALRAAAERAARPLSRVL